MKKRTFLFLVLGLAGGSLSQAQAVAPGENVPSDTAADPELATLEQLESRQDRPTIRAQLIESFLADADRLKAFRDRLAANGVRARRAKAIEAILLLRAAQAGDRAQDARRKLLVVEVRKDNAVALARRFEVAATEDHLEVDRQTGGSEEAKLTAFESVLRKLIQEFPAVPQGYESLVQLAKHSPDAKGQAIAREVLAMPAPLRIKKEAQRLLNRHALVGKSVDEATLQILGESSAVRRAKGKRLVIYSWTSESPASVAFAKSLAVKAPNAAFLGVCLDRRDVQPARELATAQNLPGEQIFDWLGRDGEVAERLGFTEPGMVYVAGADSIVRDVSAQRDLTNALK